MKTYIDVKLQIICMDNNDIVTTSTISKGDPITGSVNADAPGRRSIWD